MPIKKTVFLLFAILCISLVPPNVAYGSFSHRLAYSKKLGAEVYILSEEEKWCQRVVKVEIRLLDDSPLIQSGVNDFFKKQVSPVLDEHCPDTELAIITVRRTKDGQQLSTTKSSKEENWDIKTGSHIFENKNVIIGLAVSLGLLLLLALRLNSGNKPDHEPKVAPTRTKTKGRRRRPQIESPVYHRRIGDIPSQDASDNGGAEGAGLRGEAEVLEVIRAIGGGMVYWGLGLSINDRKCELDALVVTQHGLLHVEVKNMWGEWSPIRDPNSNYVLWKRESDKKTVKSPIRQADRARRLIGDAAKQICYDILPVHSVVVVTNDDFSFTGSNDERVALMRLGEFKKYYQDFAHGYGTAIKATSKPRLARFVSFIANHKQYPVFFDLRSLDEDKQRSTLHNIKTDTDYIDALRSLIMEVWECDKDIKKPWIWFGSTEDMAPPAKNT